MNNSIETGPINTNRSEQRIPKLRTRGRENRRRLLVEAERLLLETDGGPLKFSDVFEAAGVSRGSAYRIYIGIDDLLQDLSTEWINNFVAFLKAGVPEQQPENWGELVSFLVRRGADYWAETYLTLRVLPRFQSAAHANYIAAVREMSLCASDIFNRYFVVPEVPGWMSKLAFFTQICDITFSDAVRAEQRISEQRLVEAEVLCRTERVCDLPTGLPARSSSDS